MYNFFQFQKLTTEKKIPIIYIAHYFLVIFCFLHSQPSVNFKRESYFNKYTYLLFLIIFWDWIEV